MFFEVGLQSRGGRKRLEAEGMGGGQWMGSWWLGRYLGAGCSSQHGNSSTTLEGLSKLLGELLTCRVAHVALTPVPFNWLSLDAAAHRLVMCTWLLTFSSLLAAAGGFWLLP